MQWSGQTVVVGLFGDPVKHSLSPRMQNAAIAASGLNAVYVPFHVTAAQLCDAVAGVRAMAIRGVNLTIPHKEAACHLIDELDEHAKMIGAINTIVNDGGHLKGYNTDVLGLQNVLKTELGVDLAGRRVLLVGAGGASRAALVALGQARAAWVGIANRTRARAQQLLEDLAPNFPGTAFAHYQLGSSLANAPPEPVDLLINASAVGLQDESFGFPICACVRPGGAVYDMVYAAVPTRLIQSAKERGLVAADGRGMLAAQGEAAFQLWFGTTPAAQVMRRALQEAG
jgi:shikimate dehydrogenase